MQELIEHLHQSSFYEFAALLILAATAGLIISAFLRQPLIIAYIVVGILAGSSVLDIVRSGEELELLSELGIAVLLFIVGLKLDLSLIRNLGSAALVIGLSQIGLTAAIGFGLCVMMSISVKTSLFIATALAFSSTIIVVKILSDKHEIDQLHGQVALGILIIQDFAVILAMMYISTLSGTSGNPDANIISELIRVSGWVILLGALLWIFIRFFSDKLAGSMAHTPELLLCFSMAWAVALAALCYSIGLSKELGGLLAGISLASTPYRNAIISRLSSIRDFLLLFFFILLGARLDLSNLSEQIPAALILSAFILLFKPFIIMATAGFMGFRKRTAFLSGLSLGQISEFSFIFMTMAVAAGSVNEEALGLVTLVGLITIGLSAYAIKFSNRFYHFMEPALGVFERSSKIHKAHKANKKKKSYDAIIFGYGRYGQELATAFKKNKQNVLIVDFNPEVIEQSKKDKRDLTYGDANDPHFYKDLPLDNTKWVISAMPRYHVGLTHEDPRHYMIEALKQHKFKGKIVVAVSRYEDEKRLKKEGADIILHPFKEAAEFAVNCLDKK